MAPADLRDDGRQLWRPNLPDVVTESVEGDGRNDATVSSVESDASVALGKRGDTSPTPAQEDTGPYVFRVIRDEDITELGVGGQRVGHEEPSLHEATVAPSESVKLLPAPLQYSDISPETPVPVFIPEPEIDSDGVDSPRKPATTTTADDRGGVVRSQPASDKPPPSAQRAHPTPADSPAQSSPDESLDSDSSPAADGAVTSVGADIELSASPVGEPGSPERFWSVTPGTQPYAGPEPPPPTWVDHHHSPPVERSLRPKDVPPSQDDDLRGREDELAGFFVQVRSPQSVQRHAQPSAQTQHERVEPRSPQQHWPIGYPETTAYIRQKQLTQADYPLAGLSGGDAANHSKMVSYASRRDLLQHVHDV
ncbi:proline-rich receptor-like protein kinase PERK10 [Pollicipes pollicipes]|uniref:proline-rich receptor-like protein kinase PERK10 n=1 Tax=Pollicipes pollicipes TaxID=41117 RepID=UPI0018850190|nr:proline-rich receptor-like protein kinase PERK10 [Pollicipes pollicipes]